MNIITWSDLLMVIALNAFKKNLYRTSSRGFGCHSFTEEEMYNYNSLIYAEGVDMIVTGRVSLEEDGGNIGSMWIGLNTVNDLNGFEYRFERDNQGLITIW